MDIRVVSVAVMRHKDGDYIFQRRDFNTKNSPGKLGLFGGHIENEEPRTALLRELSEECSLKVNKDDLKFITIKIYRGLVVFYYLLEVKEKEFEVYEGAGKEVLSIEQIKAADDMAYSAKEIFNDQNL